MSALLLADANVRHLARATNLLLGGAATVVLGDGELARALRRILTGTGAHVTVVIADADARRAAHLEGVRTALHEGPLPAARFVVATGEGHPPLVLDDVRGAAVLVLDASAAGDAVVVPPGAHERVRPAVVRVATPSGDVLLVDRLPAADGTSS